MKQKSLVTQGYFGRLASYVRTYRIQLLIAVLLAFLAIPLAAHAVTTISQGYSTADKLAQGSIVSLKDNTSDTVVAATISNVNNILGVVINTDNSLLSISNTKENQVLVATNGTAAVLVSDINGPIKRGDQITASPISGVGMKASGNVRTIGAAQNDLNGGTKQTYKEKSGQEKSVNIGEVSVLVNVSYYFKEPNKTIIPSAIQNVANSLAGKEVSSLPILVSVAIFFVTLIVVVSIIYSMIRSSIISVGRNPMSQSAVYRDVIQLSSLVLVILGVSFASIYMVLKRL